jgi:hypothetical protein
MIARLFRWLRREPIMHGRNPAVPTSKRPPPPKAQAARGPSTGQRLLAVHLHFAKPRGGFSE